MDKTRVEESAARSGSDNARMNNGGGDRRKQQNRQPGASSASRNEQQQQKKSQTNSPAPTNRNNSALQGGSEAGNNLVQKKDSRRAAQPPRSGSTPIKADGNELDYGVIVSTKGDFGFIRNFKRSEDIFFHFDEIPSHADAFIGQEVSFVARLGRSGREMATRVKLLPNGTLLDLVQNPAGLPNFGPALLERGEITFVGTRSGLFMMSGRIFAVFDVSKVVDPSLKKDLACRVVYDARTGIYVAIPPFEASNKAMELGVITQAPIGGRGVLVWSKTGREMSFEWGTSPKLIELCEGDVVWFIANGPKASDIVLCTPRGEAAFNVLDSSPTNCKRAIEAWIQGEDSGRESKRACGVISAVKETFAFVRPEKGNELFMPMSELCISTPEFSRTQLKPGDFVTFEVKKTGDSKESDMASRVFAKPGLTKSIWRKSREILLASNVKGQVVNASGGVAKAIEYDALNINVVELPEVVNTLRVMKEGDVMALTGKSSREKALIAQYCKWLGSGWQMSSTSVTRGAGEEPRTKPIVPCAIANEELEEGPAYDIGHSVTFDLFLDANNGKRFAIVVPEATLSRPVLLEPGELEMGVVASTSPPVIVSGYREGRLKFSSYSGKPGDVVSFKVEQDRYGYAARAVEVKKVENIDSESIGLRPFGDNLRLRGVVVREMPKPASQPSRPTVGDVISVQNLLASSNNGPRSGLILVGPRATSFNLSRSVPQAAAATQEDKTPLDWRRENELLRVVRACKEREGDADPSHVFEGLSPAEQRAVEKEAKKNGLITKSKEQSLAIGFSKQNVDEWASRVGRRVEVRDKGSGVVLDFRVKQNGFEVKILLDGSAIGDYVFCQEASGDVTFLDQSLSLGDNSSPTVNTTSTASDVQEQTISELRSWVHHGVIPSSSNVLQVVSPVKILFKNSTEIVEACLNMCLQAKVSSEGIMVSCEPGKESLLDISTLASSEYEAKFGFAFNASGDGSNNVFPVEGDLVEFRPCRSKISGLLRATEIKLIQPRVDRVTGIVEEITSKGGWVRPKGKLSAEFFTSDLLTRATNLGDLVDFQLSEKGDRAFKVRLIQNNPRSSNPATPEAKDVVPPTERPRINQDIIANAPNASSAAYYTQAPGPDGTIGFSKEKWRGKRAVSTLKADAPEFKPSFFPPETLLATSPPPVAASPIESSSPLPTQRSKSSQQKIRSTAPSFVPSTLTPTSTMPGDAGV